MAILPGWNITAITGHNEPAIGDIAFDSARQRIWFTEPEYGIVRIDVDTNNFEIYRTPLENNGRYGAIGIVSSGGVYAGTTDNKIVRLDYDLNALPDLAIEKPLGIDTYDGKVYVLANMGNGQAVICLDEFGNRLWRRRIADGASANYFCGFAPIFCTPDGIVALIGQRNIDCYFIDYNGTVYDRRTLMLSPGSWNEDLVVRTPDQTCTPTGRRYLLNSCYCRRSNSLMFLYAPGSGDHDLVIVQWTVTGGLPNVYDVPIWATRILSINGRLVLFGSETYMGPKKLHLMTLNDLEAVPLEMFPAISTNSKGANDTPLIQDLFSAAEIMPSLQPELEEQLTS